jgi:hypothetical protein
MRISISFGLNGKSLHILSLKKDISPSYAEKESEGGKGCFVYRGWGGGAAPLCACK